jgi:hypothetical protein
LTEKKKPKNFGWEPIKDTHEAEKTVSFGANPLKTHRLAGVDDDDLMRQIEDFEARLKVANGENDD